MAVHESGEVLLEATADVVGMRLQTLPLEDLQHREADGRGYRIAAEAAEELHAVGEGLGDGAGGHHRPQRVAVPHGLAQRDDVRHDALGLEPPHVRTDAAEPHLNLVGDAESPRFAGMCVGSVQISGRWLDLAPARQEGLAQEGRGRDARVVQLGQGSPNVGRVPVRP